MGRSYFAEETVGQYLSELTVKSKSLITGLLVGQCSPQRDYIVLAIRTPPKDEESKSNASYGSELSTIDEEWATAHAKQVSRMLPGGLLVLGVFIVAVPELAKEIQNTLHKLVFSVEKSIARKRLWSISEDDVSDRVALHLCSATKKILCRTYDIQDPKNGLTRWAKQIEEAVVLINGQVRKEDADLVDGQKKSVRGTMQSATQSLDARVLTQLSQKSNSRSMATVQICSGSINLKGALKCKAYIHNNKPKVKDAVKALKRDIINTLSDRCEILFEDLLMNETPESKSSEREYRALPGRVFAPVAGSWVLFCDYKFGDETVKEIQERFHEMLDQAVQAEDLHAVEEMSTVEVISPKEFPDDIKHKQLTKETLLLKLHQNIGVVIAVAVAISAVAFSFNYFSD